MGKTTAPMNPGGDASSPSPDQLRADMARTRAEMAETLDQLHGKLNPAVLKDQALEQFHEAKEKVKAELAEDFENVKCKIRDEIQEAKAAVRDATIGRVETMYHEAGDKVRETGHDVVDAVRSNPIPIALIGVGLGWLFVAPRLRSRRIGFRDEPTLRGLGGQKLPYGDGTAYYEEESVETTPSAADKARDAARSVGESLGAAGERVGELANQAGTSIKSATTSAARGVSTAAHDASAAVGQLAHRTSESARRMARSAAVQARQLEQRGVDVYQANPLAVGACFVAIGAALGFMLPRTSRENEWLGARGDQLRAQVRGKAEELAHGALDKVEDAAARATDRLAGERQGEPEVQIEEEGFDTRH
jgi:hypothetical protein